MEAFTNRLKKNVKHLGKWARRQGLEAYRVYDKDLPDVPIVVERYGSKAVVYHSIRFDDDWDRVEPVAQAVSDVLDIAKTNVFSKFRVRHKRGEQYEKLETQQIVTTVAEGPYRFEVNVSDYLDTGLFLDQRANRKKIGEMAKGARLLNLFAYTGSFTVYGVGGGAIESETVDMSSTYLEWCGRNLDLNGLRSDVHRLVRQDVFQYLRDAREQGKRFDIIVCDPPTFSRGKKMFGTLDIQRDYTGLLHLALKVLDRDGVLFFSTNHRGFKLNPEELAGFDVRDLSPGSIPKDYRDRAAHQAWFLRPA